MTGEAVPGSTPAWEDPRAPFPRNFLDTWLESVSQPTRFFRRVPFEDAAARPILYYLIISIVGAAFSLWWTSVFTAVGFPFAPSAIDPWMGLEPTANALVSFFAAPFLAFFALVLWSGLLQVLAAVFAREHRGYRSTLRVVCYASGPQILTVVPLIGGPVGMVWSLALTVIGLREAHRMTTGAAIGVVAIGVLVPVTLLFGLFVFVFASLAAIA